MAVGAGVLIGIDWWQRLDFSLEHRKGLARLGVFLLAALFSPWFKWSLLGLGTAFVVGLHVYDTRIGQRAIDLAQETRSLTNEIAEFMRQRGRTEPSLLINAYSQPLPREIAQDLGIAEEKVDDKARARWEKQHRRRWDQVFNQARNQAMTDYTKHVTETSSYYQQFFMPRVVNLYKRVKEAGLPAGEFDELEYQERGIPPTGTIAMRGTIVQLGRIADALS